MYESLAAVPVAPILIGGVILFGLGEGAKEVVVTVFEKAMRAIWEAALAVLKAAFKLADRLSVFSITEDGGPVDTTWPITLWISGVVALGLFFWQLTMTMLRGGRGFVRLVAGPAQYGIALGVTVGMVAALLVAADELTRGLLTTALDADNFTEAFKHTSFGGDAVKGLKAVLLGVCALFGVLPAAFGYVLEMLFREAAIHLLIAVVPITAAGLTAGVTARWFWTSARWILAAIAMKPVLALTLVLGVAVAGGTKGLSGLLVGTAVLLMSLFAPLVLFRLFAFVDPATDAGATFRSALAGHGLSAGGMGHPTMGPSAGSDGYAGFDADDRGSDSGTGGGSPMAMAEARTTQRFDASADGPRGDDASGGGPPSAGGRSAGGGGSSSSADGEAGGAADAATAAAAGGGAGAAAGAATAAGGAGRDGPDPAVADPPQPDPGPTPSPAEAGWPDTPPPAAAADDPDAGAPQPDDGDDERHRPYRVDGDNDRYDDGTVI